MIWISDGSAVEIGYVFDVLSSPKAIGFIPFRRTLGNAVQDADGGLTLGPAASEEVVRLLTTDWPRVCERYGTTDGFAEHAIPAPDDPDRDLLPDFAFAGACLALVRGDETEARRSLDELANGDVGQPEWPAFYAASLARVLRAKGWTAAMSLLGAWRTGRLADIGLDPRDAGDLNVTQE